MVLSIAAGPVGSVSPPTGAERDATLADARGTLVIGTLVVLAFLVLYAVSGADRTSPYDHFVRQADAFLHGRAAIELPVPGDPSAPGNGYLQDAMPVLDAAGDETGFALIPFPPLPAILLMPLVALFGLATNGQWFATILAAIAVGLGFRLLARLPIGRPTRLVATVFFGAGTVFWYAAAVGTTWFLAHVVAVTFAFLALDVALAADDAWDERPLLGLIDRRQLLAGFLLGLAATARLPVALGAPVLMHVGGGGTFLRRTLAAGLGMALPIGAMLAYNLVSTGHLFHPAYDYQYQREAWGYPWLGYHPDWAIEDVRYLPQNLALMLGGLPTILPACPPGTERAVFDPGCPFVVPEPIGMSLLLTSPAWLLAASPIARFLRGEIGSGSKEARLVAGAVPALIVIALLNLMHFSQGWVQFGYRFSNDMAPFALPLVALGADRFARSGRGAALVLGLVAVSVAVNWWGLTWGKALGW